MQGINILVQFYCASCHKASRNDLISPEELQTVLTCSSMGAKILPHGFVYAETDHAAGKKAPDRSRILCFDCSYKEKNK